MQNGVILFRFLETFGLSLRRRDRVTKDPRETHTSIVFAFWLMAKATTAPNYAKSMGESWKGRNVENGVIEKNKLSFSG